MLGVLVFEAGRRSSPPRSSWRWLRFWPTRPPWRCATPSCTTRCPMVDALGALAAKKRALLAVPRRRLQLYGGIALAILAALFLIRWPFRVVGNEAAFRPMALTPVRALVPGVVERILVREGVPVERGTARRRCAPRGWRPIGRPRRRPSPRRNGRRRSRRAAAIRPKSGSSGFAAMHCARSWRCWMRRWASRQCGRRRPESS